MALHKSLDEILKFAIFSRASDVHLGEGVYAAMRVDGALKAISEEVMSHDEIKELLLQHLSEERFKQFQKERELDYSFGVSGLGRFRVNLYFQRSSIGAAIRALPFDPMSYEEIGFPRAVAENLIARPSGLVLVTGPTGSGKTTTLAAMINHINETHPCHIVTIEDPIEFLFKNKKARINQREVGSDTLSFNGALRHVLRQDPEVILIGEMRDLETIETALMVAETGHLVFATLHTPDAVQSINRVIDVFPADQQQQVRVQLSFVLQAVISQQLVGKIGSGRTLASEILIATQAVRSLIRDSKTHQIYSIVQTGQKDGMRTLNMSLAELVKANKISKEEAYAHSSSPQELERLLTGK